MDFTCAYRFIVFTDFIKWTVVIIQRLFQHVLYETTTVLSEKRGPNRDNCDNESVKI